MTDEPALSRRGVAPAQSRWPRSYILDIYQQAITHGHILLHPITKEDASSLTKSIYNIRRRSKPGEANATFITPDHHLVTVGLWRPDSGGTLPVYYTTTDEKLPTITPAAGATTPLGHHTPQEPPSPVDEDFGIAPDEVDSFVTNLLNESRKRDT